MRRIFVVFVVVIVLALNGCGKNEKRNITSPSLAVDTASATQELASNILDSVVGGFTGSSTSSPALAPSLASVIGMPRTSFSATSDANLYYTVNSSDFVYYHPFWDWATTISIKVKQVDADNGDIIGAWLAGLPGHRSKRTQPITLYKIIEAENDKRKVKEELTHKFDYNPTNAEYPGLGVVDGTTHRVTLANGVTVKVTHTNLKTNVVGTMTIQSIDAFIADGRWIHQLTADYTDTSRKSHFDLTRNNDKASAYFGYHTGDGNIYKDDVLIAKVHLNGDGTGYYTLASENFATQHEFNNEREKKRKIAR